METDFYKSLVIASGGWFAVGPILMILLLLGTKNGPRKSTAFLVGIVVTYVIIGVAVHFIHAGFAGVAAKTPRGSVLYLVVGIAFLVFGVLGLLKPGHQNIYSAKLMEKIQNLGTAQAMGMGAAAALVTPKNLVIYLSAISSLPSGEQSPGSIVFFTLILTLVFCLTMILPVLGFLLFRARVSAWLTRARELLSENSHAVVTGVLLVFGVLFSIQGFYGLSVR